MTHHDTKRTAAGMIVGKKYPHSLDSSMPKCKLIMAALLNSLFFVFNISFVAYDVAIVVFYICMNSPVDRI